VCFEQTSLQQIGLCVQFGHADCTRPRIWSDKFVVIDIGHIHVVTVAFCGCERQAEMGSFEVQLLRRQWFPATNNLPHTAATFRVLDFFLLQTHQAKTTAFDFYTATEKSTDATRILKLPSRYREFLRMVREYRHLLLLKRGGRGHDPAGVDATKPGELAIRCPACPRPGINLPDDWEKAPPERRYAAGFLAQSYN
jgi:hypothetical protein